METNKDLEQSAQRNRELQWAGLLLKKERLEKGWSQESVCKGICAVSTLSKIESGKAVGSEEILGLLAKRLDVSLMNGNAGWNQRREELWKLLQAGQTYDALCLLEQLEAQRKEQGELPDLTWLLLLGLFKKDDSWKLLEDAQSLMNRTDRMLYGILNREYEQVLLLQPDAWIMQFCMDGLYRQRGSETRVLEIGVQAYEKAAEEGELLLMAEISTFQGMVSSNLMDLQAAFRYMKRAEKMYLRLEAWPFLDEIYYNLGCTWMSVGRFDQAWEYLEKIRSLDTRMPLNKLAICYEQLGNPEKALALLDQARNADSDGWSDEMTGRMIDVTRYRLEHADWLHQEEYGRKLMSLFDELSQTDIHKGFAQFYLPWVIQWLKTSRQYARLVDVLEHFSKLSLFEPVKG